MVKNAIFILFLLSSITLSAQEKIEFQLGGANFLGCSVNAEFDIPINKDKEHFIMPRFGIGTLIPKLEQNLAIANFGLHYRIKKVAAGVELSGFTLNPFLGKETRNEFVDMIIYPNLNYSFTFKQLPKLYLKLSSGAYFAFSKDFDIDTNKITLEWENDPIPGAGLTVGHRFN